MFTPQRPPRGSTTSRSRPALRQVYQELQPTSEWKQEEGCAVLVVHVPGSYKPIYYLFHSSNSLFRLCILQFLCLLICPQ